MWAYNSGWWVRMPSDTLLYDHHQRACSAHSSAYGLYMRTRVAACSPLASSRYLITRRGRDQRVDARALAGGLLR